MKREKRVLRMLLRPFWAATNGAGKEGGGGRESVIESRGPKGVKENEHGSGERKVADGDGERGKANIISLLHSAKFHGGIAAKERVRAMARVAGKLQR